MKAVLAWVMIASSVALLSAPGCKGSGGADAKKICQEAADKYGRCIGEVLGPEAEAYVSRPEKDGRALCAADPMTVEMYRECLPKAGCEDFMKCLTDYAERTGP